MSSSEAQDQAPGRVQYANGYAADQHYPAALVNVTNRCNLSCAHCFVFREGNPNEPQRPRFEISTPDMLRSLTELRDRHGISFMLWMGGEPLLRKDLLVEGVKLFTNNNIVTNGTVPLIDLGPNALYIVSLDGPEEVNDAVRGKGTFRKVLRTLSRVSDGFTTPIQVQCVVTKKNQAHLEPLVEELLTTKAGWMTFSFYVARKNDDSDLGWPSLEARMEAVREVMRLKERHPDFIRNRRRSLELMSPELAPAVTSTCVSKRVLIPLYLEGDHFATPFCCYGNDADCDTCGAWVVFDLAARFGQ